MAKEIERKFLVKDFSFIKISSYSVHIRQAYLSTTPESTVRVRIMDNDAFLTVKGRNSGIVRDEWEFPIPKENAKEIAHSLCGGFAIDKTRYIVDYDGWKWEIDLFHGRHEGLCVAEIEMPSSDSNPPLPSFIGEEVTGDTRYYNSVLSMTSGVPERL